MPINYEPSASTYISVSGMSIPSYVFVVGQPIASLTSTSGGTNYTISPALPSGLSINAGTGEISGTPSSVSATTTTYTIQKSVMTVTTSGMINIQVLAVNTMTPVTAKSTTFINGKTYIGASLLLFSGITPITPVVSTTVNVTFINVAAASGYLIVNSGGTPVGVTLGISGIPEMGGNATVSVTMPSTVGIYYFFLFTGSGEYSNYAVKFTVTSAGPSPDPYDAGLVLASTVIGNVNFPTPPTPPTTLTSVALNGYFTTLEELIDILTPTDYLIYRQAFIDKLFTKAATINGSPVAKISIEGLPSNTPASTTLATFPYTQAEVETGTIKPAEVKTLINYAVQNYIEKDLGGSSDSKIVTDISKLILGQANYVNMPNTNGNIFTYAFNNFVVRVKNTNAIATLLSVCPYVDTSSNVTAVANIYVQVVSGVPGYRIKVLTSPSEPLIYSQNGMVTNTFYIIINPSTNVNWSAVDATTVASKQYKKYTIIQYNGVTITGTGYAVLPTTLLTTVPSATAYSPAQTSMLVEFKLGKQQLSFTFMMGSINGLGGSLTTLPTSNICFPAGTPITTDQGRIPIEHLNHREHTLQGQVIQHITRTVTLDKYLISIPAHALGRNYPSQTTVLTKDHKIEYKGQLMAAERFLNFSSAVKRVQYSGEVLYNVLLANYGVMIVNNLTCETLHPENAIAKLYNSNISETYKQNLIQVMNDALQTRDLHAYKSIINRL